MSNYGERDCPALPRASHGGHDESRRQSCRHAGVQHRHVCVEPTSQKKKKGDVVLTQCSLLDVARFSGRNRRTLRFTARGPLAELEKELVKYIQEQQRNRRPVRLGLVLARAKGLVQHLDESGHTLMIRDRPFKVSREWGRRFLARQGLCYRKTFVSMITLHTNTRWRPWALCRDSFLQKCILCS